MADRDIDTFCDCDLCSARNDRRAEQRFEDQPMKVCALSDQHGTLPPASDIPPCDLLLIAGDLCPTTNHGSGFQADWLDRNFRRWLESLTHCKHIVGICGNHDFVFQDAPHLVPRDLPWTYLQDSGTEVAGFKIWGTPWQPWFYDWAFNGRPEQLKERWALIPHGTDILVVHGPPRGYGDLTGGTTPERTGCPHLLERITEVRPQLTVFGHIHEGRGAWDLLVPVREAKLLRAWEEAGTESEVRNGPTHEQLHLANVTILDRAYQYVHKPMMFELEARRREAA